MYADLCCFRVQLRVVGQQYVHQLCCAALIHNMLPERELVICYARELE